MDRLLIATRNQGKFRELVTLLAGTSYSLVSLADVCVEAEAPETGSTFEENASTKATIYGSLSGLPTLADDSGLEVDALGGEPGVLSSRYAGEGATDAQRIEFLLSKLNNVREPNRGARFRCVIALAWPGEGVNLYSGGCRGRIAETPRGSGGFGYDPVFLVEELGKSMADLTENEKNRVSHRGIAARGAAAALRQRAARK